jgi:hypothetical protein
MLSSREFWKRQKPVSMAKLYLVAPWLPLGKECHSAENMSWQTFSEDWHHLSFYRRLTSSDWNIFSNFHKMSQYRYHSVYVYSSLMILIQPFFDIMSLREQCGCISISMNGGHVCQVKCNTSYSNVLQNTLKCIVGTILAIEYHKRIWLDIPTSIQLLCF